MQKQRPSCTVSENRNVGQQTVTGHKSLLTSKKTYLHFKFKKYHLFFYTRIIIISE